LIDRESGNVNSEKMLEREEKKDREGQGPPLQELLQKILALRE
jgi:hypothetical protein